MDWLNTLRRSIADHEASGEPLLATLANVDAQSIPTARNVVVRRVADDGTLWITSHAMSQKNRDLQRDAGAAMVFWFPRTREQFRLRGLTKVINTGNDPTELLTMWDALSDTVRATFYWPPPGLPMSQALSEFPKFPPAGVSGPPETFEVLVLTPRLVDYLDLRPHPHNRRQWIRDAHSQEWLTEAITP